jgi:hypothetical protein
VNDHVVLLAPSSNRVYAGSADALTAAELTILLGQYDSTPEIEPVEIAGVGYLRVGLAELDAAAAAAIARLSAVFAVFRREGEHLLPVALQSADLFDDDLVTIPKYPGKTNEQFTRLLLNVTLASCTRTPSGAVSVLDPLCGRGTTLSCALTQGYDAAGVDADQKAMEAYAAFLSTYLRRKRLKHTVTNTPVRREGKSVGRRLDVEVTPPRADRALRLSVLTGDTRQSAGLYGKRKFDAVVTDAPYGIVHGSQTDVRGVSGARDRSPAGLIGEALGVWAGQLKSGGALGLSWNTFGLTRERLTDLAAEAGLVPRNEGPYLRFGHRVDSSIARDLFVAVKP